MTSKYIADMQVLLDLAWQWFSRGELPTPLFAPLKTSTWLKNIANAVL
ncbi:hypothetical protein Rctr197k_198 [Virus Rctr197k]|nr:hypothetical protein Rctr197k_198 [Virus Rctr197k]